MSELEKRAWFGEQRFLIVAFFIGLPLMAAVLFFYNFMAPDFWVLNLVFYDWFSFSYTCVVGAWIYAVLSWRLMLRKDKSREGKH